MPHHANKLTNQREKEGMQEIRFDDLEALREKITGEFSDWGPDVEVTQDMIQEFADITLDQQWIHVDVERARQGPFGAPVAHGLLTISLLPRLKPSYNFRIVGEDSRVNYGAESFRFLDPVKAGASIHARIRLVDVREHKGGVLLTQEMQVQVVGSERPSLIFKGLLLYKPAP